LTGGQARREKGYVSPVDQTMKKGFQLTERKGILRTNYSKKIERKRWNIQWGAGWTEDLQNKKKEGKGERPVKRNRKGKSQETMDRRTGGGLTNMGRVKKKKNSLAVGPVNNNRDAAVPRRTENDNGRPRKKQKYRGGGRGTQNDPLPQ